MTDFSYEPFEMDEVIPPQGTVSVSRTIDNDIDINYDEPDIEACVADHNELRSRADDIRNLNFTDIIRNQLGHYSGNASPIAGGANIPNPTDVTTEDEPTYDEDVDDKFDYKLQKKIEEEYRELQLDSVDAMLTPPENFSCIINKMYRSSFPHPNNFGFLKKLKLKSILCLIPEAYPSLQLEFFKEQNIKLFQLGMSGNKEPFVKISGELITEAIKIVMNPENQPILIHCNRGKHRTGCLVGVIRRLQQWSLTIIFDEYRKFAAPKERPMDIQFIELYDLEDIQKYCMEREWLPLKWD